MSMQNEKLVRIMTQGGRDYWLCPGCGADWSCLHFSGSPVGRQTYASGGIRSDCLTIPFYCEHGHRFDLSLDVCSGSLSVRIENFTTDESGWL